MPEGEKDPRAKMASAFGTWWLVPETSVNFFRPQFATTKYCHRGAEMSAGAISR